MTRSTVQYNYYHEALDEVAFHVECNIIAAELRDLLPYDRYQAIIDALPLGTSFLTWKVALHTEYDQAMKAWKQSQSDNGGNHA